MAEYTDSKDCESIPLDNDTLTQLLYLHDDEITQLFARISQLEQRLRNLENTKN